ncbi:MAG: 3-deoxy-manno-octulosonate cytidylyltransferase [Pyrinomonadaceae bacterium]
MNHTDINSNAHVVAIIPARFHSTRLSGKPLLDIAGKPMIVRVCERAQRAEYVSRVIVATDDTRIFDAVTRAGFEALMTREDHVSGSDRLAEVAAQLEKIEIVVNVQGDEPLIAPETIDRAVAALLDDKEAQVATVCEKFEDARDVWNADIVKVVVDENNRAIYFSRSPIPFPREAVRKYGSLENALQNEPRLIESFRKHTGLYVYRREFLLEYARQPPSELEIIEGLEQLRVLERGATICVVEAAAPSIGVDTAEDLERVRASFKFQVPS